MKKKAILILITIILAAGMQVAFAGTVHLEGGIVNDATDATSSNGNTYKIYKVSLPSETASGTIGTFQGAPLPNPNSWLADVGTQLTTQWAVNDYHICIVDKETNSGTANHKGYYAVTAMNITSGNDTFPAVTLAPIPIPVATAGAGSVSLTWEAAASGGAASDIYGYDVYRSTSQTSGFVRLNSNPVTITSYTDSNVASGTTYYYVLRLVYRADAGTRLTSTYDSANSNAATPNPAPPSGPTVTGVNPNNGPTSAVTNLTVTGTNFTGVTAVKVGTTDVATFSASSATSLTATVPAGIAAGTYDVTVTTPNGTSATSAADQFTVFGSPPAPTTLAGTAESSTSIRWSWTDNATYETGFRLQDTQNANKATTPANVVTTVEASLSPNTAYTRQVRSYNAVGESAPSNQATVWTRASAPTNLQTAEVTSTTAKINWQPGSGGAAGYNVYKAPDNGGVPGTYTKLTSGEAATTYNDSGLIPGTSYWYKIGALNGNGDETQGNPLKVTTPQDDAPPTITNVKADGTPVFDNDIIAKRPTFEATITDNASVDASSITVQIGGNTYSPITSPAVTYNAATGKMTLSLANDLAVGNHTLQITAKDIYGNQANYQVALRVTSGSDDNPTDGNVFNYPNPFNPYGGEKTKIGFNLNQPASVSIYIFDTAARLVWHRQASFGVGYHEVEWDGINDYGESAGNGVYLGRVVFNSKVDKKLKIWVVNK